MLGSVVLPTLAPTLSLIDARVRDPRREVASKTRALINAGGANAAYAVEHWALANPDAAHAPALLSIAGNYDFVSEEERVELLNNTVAYYVRDTSKRSQGEDGPCSDAREAMPTVSEEKVPRPGTERIALSRVGRRGTTFR